MNREYRAILGRVESIGGLRNNPLESVLVFGCLAIAFYKSADGRISEEDFSVISDAIGESRIVKFISSRNKAFSEKALAAQKKQSEKSQRKRYKFDWVSTFKHEPGSGEYFLTHTSCGLCKLAAQEEVMPLVKHLCKLDYPMFGYQGVVLDRTKTLGFGDDQCNFHVMTKEKAEEVGFVKGPDAK